MKVLMYGVIATTLISLLYAALVSAWFAVPIYEPYMTALNQPLDEAFGRYLIETVIFLLPVFMMVIYGSCFFIRQLNSR